MNILKQDRRRSRVRKARLEILDERIVPSTVQPALAAAAEVATVHASAESAGTTTAESQIQIRHENRMIRIEERHELKIERRDARLARLAELRHAAHDFSAAVVVETPAAQAAAIAAATAKRAHTTSGSSGGNGSSSSGSSPGSGSGSTGTTLPVTPVTTTAGTGSGTSGSGTSSGSGSTTTTPLPANASALLDTVYEEYLNGDLPTTASPGQVEIQGTNVGIEIRSSSPSNFSATVAAAESLGLQVTTVSDAYDTVVGFLPIAQLPAAAQLSGAPSITPLLYPTSN
jgi:hypothetical protein